VDPSDNQHREKRVRGVLFRSFGGEFMDILEAGRSGMEGEKRKWARNGKNKEIGAKSQSRKVVLYFGSR
jgi:hypothetical protein